MNCKNCMQELPEEAVVCPACGEAVEPAEETSALCEDTLEVCRTEGEEIAAEETCEAEAEAPAEETCEAEAEVPAKKKLRVLAIAAAGLAGLVLLLSLSVVVYWSVIGVESFDEGVQSIVRLVKPRPNDISNKDSYSVSAEKAQKQHDKVIATVGGQELTNGTLQVYYWMDVLDFLNNYGYYAVYMGLDYTQPLDQQSHPDGGTWQQYFLNNALTGWHNYQAMALVAQEEGYKLDETLQENLDTLRENLAASAVEGGFSGIDAMLQQDMGPGCNFEDYYNYMQVYYTGYMYFGEKYAEFDVTDAMIEAYFAEHQEELAESGITKESGDLADVRHILIAPEGGTEDEEGEITYSEAEWEACKAAARKLLDEWLAGDATEESFAALVAENTDDSGSAENGGLYEGVKKDSGYVEEFEAWCLDESRKEGDYGLIKTEYGYHIMYFCDSEAQWISESRNGVLSELSAEVLQAAIDKYPMTVNYNDIALGVVDLSSES